MQRASEWFARNPVAANLLMASIVIGGLIGMDRVRGEAFPDVALDRLVIEMPYPAAAPEEVETAVCVRIEEAVQSIEGIEEIVSTAYDGLCRVVVDIASHADARGVLDDVKTRVDAIETFPERAEEPIITEGRTQIRVVDVAVSGRADELTLKRIAEGVRDELLGLPGITQVRFASVRPYEIAIEVSESALRRHGLTFDDVAHAVRRSSIDLPGGAVQNESGEIRLRTVGQAYRGRSSRTWCSWRAPTARGCTWATWRRWSTGSPKPISSAASTASPRSSSRSSAPAGRATWRSPARWTTTWNARPPRFPRASG